ncbi:MAG: thiamine/thiamine pyrophosphate ABC transporter permease ThiP [Cardiobacteriaceae bacterium]|nr:thiamine/thiamine pyrophosphate ABC transporter permease ThiP [Cardiobacteriaceae bacterium]
MLTGFISPQFRPKHYLGGIAVIVSIIGLYFFSLHAVFSAGETYSWRDFWQDTYLRHVLYFSVWQASLSTALSVIIGGIFARALFYQKFYGKSLLLKVLSMTFILPSLMVIFGLIGIYGASGWLAKLMHFLHIQWQPTFYGLPGILMANLFFNVPFAARFFLQSLQSIPSQQHQLAAQLNIRRWQFIRLIEFPYFKRQLFSVSVLIFMLCFTGFTIVLTLGGGPKYTTLEVAIYQALMLDFDIAKAAWLALLQFILCAFLFAVSHFLAKPADIAMQHTQSWIATQDRIVKIWQILIITMVSLFIFMPLLNIVVSACLSDAFFSAWQNPQLWRAIGYSFSIAPISAFLALFMSIALLLLTRRLYWLQRIGLADALININMIILAIPTLILATGLFLLLQRMSLSNIHLFAIMVCCNALSSMPFVLRVLSYPMNNNMIYYEKLCLSLGISAWTRWRLIEWHHLAWPMKYAFALAFSLSLGDFTAIALFGNPQFTSLPYLLYQQLGSYRGEQASVTALILLIVCLIVFCSIERKRNSGLIEKY